MGKASLDLTVLDLRTEAQGAEYEKNNNDCPDQPDDVVHASLPCRQLRKGWNGEEALLWEYKFHLPE